jgi:uncharacterized membrane protein
MHFVKTTFLGGLVVVLPLLLLWLGIAEVFGLLVELSTPLALLLPAGWVERVNAPVLIAVGSLVLASFLLGLSLRSRWMVRLGRGIERGVLERMPMYRMVKRLSTSLLDRQARTFAPALMLAEDGSAEVAYLIEELDDGYVTLLLPWAPAAFAGSVRLVRREKVRRLDCTLDDFSRCLAHLGLGLRELVEQRQPAGLAPSDAGSASESAT